ncbi:MAG: MBL fold metallo-hydrolase [Deltaproteobacteria bacterium]|jgi:L-ascorbate metabolism protein UlaG (beta-lactamase superfamily)|nr:MBL fold metallo-hydrolase [Deltaproteobacteria bacterium]
MLKLLLVCSALLSAAFVGGVLFLRSARFGALASGLRLSKIKLSPNFIDGRFQNLVPIPKSQEPKRLEMLKKAFGRHPNRRPSTPLPSVREDLRRLPNEAVVWFGHSTFLLKLSDLLVLVDPVFSDHASPFSFLTKAFPGTNPYHANDIPDIDCLLISHDHWDHLDYPTIKLLKNKIATFVAPLGVGAHLARWGVPEDRIYEGDWWDVFEPKPGFKVTLTPSRHFAGRGLKWLMSLWTGFALEYGNRKILYTGDGGYGAHFKDIGQKFGAFDLAIVECGQYDELWRHAHLTPEQSVKVALEVRARAAMPVHLGKFVICYHPWSDPLKRFVAAAEKNDLLAITPIIGSILDLTNLKSLPPWWTKIE